MPVHASVLKTYALNLSYLETLLGDVPAERAADQPGGVVNHPLWVVGHLALSASQTLEMIGGEPFHDPAWPASFGGGSNPVSDVAAYPPLSDMLESLASGHEQITRQAVVVDDAVLAAANPAPMLAQQLPTLGDMLTFLLTTHEAVHIGQISAWRRAAGFKPLF